MRLTTAFLLLIIVFFGISSCKKSVTQPPTKEEPAPIVNPEVDIYIGGSFNNKAAYWKNEELHKINEDSRNSIGFAITTKGADVYLAGITINNSMENIATCWKNGVPTYLSTNTGVANAVAVHNNDVYVVGQTARIYESKWVFSATVWKMELPLISIMQLIQAQMPFL